MIPIIEFQERSLSGPVMKADEFDMEFAMKIRDVVKKYNIEYNENELVVDDATADAVFQAAVELLAEVGIYHMDTERVIKLTREEIEQVAKEYCDNPGRHTFGRDKDEVTIEYRASTDKRPPTLYAGSWGVAQEEWYVPYIQSFAQEKSIKAMGITAGLAKLGNMKAKAGTPSEIAVGLWEQEHIKEALQKAGRPGLHVGLLATLSSPSGIMTMMAPGIREAYNTQIGVHIIPEMKISWSQLVLAQFCQVRGIQPWQSSMSMIGGLCRNAQDTAVGLTANLLGQLSYAHGQLCSLFTNHMDGKSATRPTHWAYSAAARASERNIKVCIGGCASGVLCKSPFTLIQAVNMATLFTASSMSYCWIAGNTGIEARYAGEVMDAIAGMERGQANELVNNMMDLQTKHAPEVKGNTCKFPEVYDLETVQPHQWYVDYLDKAKEELAGCGVPY